MTCPDCGRKLVEGLRYERGARAPLRVRWCPLDGYETPPFYDRSAAARNGDRVVAVRACRECGASVVVDARFPERASCDLGCSLRRSRRGQGRDRDGRIRRAS
jgi:hypothetical protein